VNWTAQGVPEGVLPSDLSKCSAGLGYLDGKHMKKNKKKKKGREAAKPGVVGQGKPGLGGKESSSPRGAVPKRSKRVGRGRGKRHNRHMLDLEFEGVAGSQGQRRLGGQRGGGTWQGEGRGRGNLGRTWAGKCCSWSLQSQWERGGVDMVDLGRGLGAICCSWRLQRQWKGGGGRNGGQGPGKTWAGICFSGSLQIQWKGGGQAWWAWAEGGPPSAAFGHCRNSGRRADGPSLDGKGEGSEGGGGGGEGPRKGRGRGRERGGAMAGARGRGKGRGKGRGRGEKPWLTGFPLAK